MSRKRRFKPMITRVKLNPEQAVLACTCYGDNQGVWGGVRRGALIAADATYCTDTLGRTTTSMRDHGTCGPGGSNYYPMTPGDLSS